jgi:hypothetical protein
MHAATPFPMTAATGGTLVSGTYFATAVDVYQAGTAPSFTHAVLVVDAAAGVLWANNDDPASLKVAATYTASGSTLSLTLVCGLAGAGQAVDYTATAAQIVLYATETASVETFAKQ